MSVKSLASINRVAPDLGKAQWVEGCATGIAGDIPKRTHTVGIPPLMPGTIIFVHGVNSEGEWYSDAARQFCEGLNKRLGRVDLVSALVDPSTKRFRAKTEGGKNPRSPVIPFYWGYSANGTGPDGKPNKRKLTSSRDTLVDRYGSPLRSDGTWGGGPFQNGTTSLLQFWHGGFRENKLFSLVNPIIGRELRDCPDRIYYAHAARRLAYLVCTIREDFPNEPINIIAHSQGTMVALCSLFYVDEWKTRGPDTVMLNNSPYHFDAKLTDWVAAAGGWREVQTEEARVATFRAAADILQRARSTYDETRERQMPSADCTHTPQHRHAHDDRIFVHYPPSRPDWQADIGAGVVTDDGRTWWVTSRHERDNRGSLFVNFNPGDRVMGIAAVQGMGWRGIPLRYLDEQHQPLGANVMQRMFARGSNDHNAPVGQRTRYRVSYYFQQIVRTDVKSDSGTTWRVSDGEPLQTEQRDWRYLDDGDPRKTWKIASERILGLFPVLSTPGYVNGEGGESETVLINAPLVPLAAVLPPEFDGAGLRYDGEAQEAKDGQPETLADTEQQEDFADDVTYQVPRTITVKEDGRWVTREETLVEIERRRRNAVGHKVVSPTNHSQILRFKGEEGFPVERVLSYDLTVGRGYAFGDEAYWNYLLDLADWKKSDPYFFSGELEEQPGVENAPAGIARQTVSMPEYAAPGAQS